MSQIDEIDECWEGELQLRFDGALASITSSIPPDPLVFHHRLRRRRIRTSVAGLAGLVVMVSLVVTVGVAGSSDPSSATMTLYARDDAGVSQGELSADAKIIRDRLDSIGDEGARVSVHDGAVVVAGGTVELVDSTSVLTELPVLLVRPLLCQSGPFDGSTPPSPQTLPLGCAETPYVLEPDSPDPDGSHGGNFTTAPFDPALAQFPTTTPSADSAHPGGAALLPIANGNGERDLVGSTRLTLSSNGASARVVQGTPGRWLVDVSLSPSETALLGEVASKYLPMQLVIDLNGEVVSTPIIEPASSSDQPFDGRLELAGPTQAWADEIAAALESGPLPIPLELAHAA
jgi:hypothetical protein